MPSMWCLYILRCSDDSFYVGISNNVAKRVEAHNAGKGAKYTRSRHPVELIYQETFSSKIEAMRREVQIKRWPRFKKQALVLGRAQ